MLLQLIDVVAGKWFDWRTRRNAAAFFADNPELNTGLMLKRAEVKDDRIEVLLSHPAIIELAESAAAILDETNTFNYFFFDMFPRPDHYKGRQVRVTIQWTHMKSPEQKNMLLVEALNEIERRIDQLPKQPPLVGFDFQAILSIVRLAREGIDWKLVVGEA